jgi:hypothetical protein
MIEEVETGEIIGITNIYAGFVHVAEKIIGYENWLGEYPTLSAVHLPEPFAELSAFRRYDPTSGGGIEVASRMTGKRKLFRARSPLLGHGTPSWMATIKDVVSRGGSVRGIGM